VKQFNLAHGVSRETFLLLPVSTLSDNLNRGSPSFHVLMISDGHDSKLVSLSPNGQMHYMVPSGQAMRSEDPAITQEHGLLFAHGFFLDLMPIQR
jgi:hypothetical protein